MITSTRMTTVPSVQRGWLGWGTTMKQSLYLSVAGNTSTKTLKS